MFIYNARHESTYVRCSSVHGRSNLASFVLKSSAHADNGNNNNGYLTNAECCLIRELPKRETGALEQQGEAIGAGPPSPTPLKTSIQREAGERSRVADS